MDLSGLKQFNEEAIDEYQLKAIQSLAVKARRDALRMITCAGSGHPGGALSSIDLYTVLWLCANVDPQNSDMEGRDQIIASHGHTSAAVYSVLGHRGFFDVNKAIGSFRKDGSIFEGHPGLKVPGVEWCSGSLGQGLSVGCGFALAAKIKKTDSHVFVMMGDGEQGKGQLQEAREFAVKYGLGNLTAVIDYNGLQASGKLENVMPQNIMEKYKAAGWRVLQANGHNYNEIYKALRECYMNKDTPALVLAYTVMGKGVSFIEDNYEYHGKVLTEQQLQQAFSELPQAEDTACGLIRQNGNIEGYSRKCISIEEKVEYGTPVLYEKGKAIDCRSAFGEALCNIAAANNEKAGVHIAALDCDLAESVKLQKFGLKFPENLIECGIQEHNAATVAGALSKSGILTFLADFGVFGIDEMYSQHRMSDINNTSIKLVCTHNGLDVGEDGKTHQCIDYISLMSNLFGFKVIIPADSNQTDRAVRYAATNPGNMVIAVGRSKVPVLTDECGKEFFDKEYSFEYGKADWIRCGGDGTVITYGTMVHRAVNACDKLKALGIDIGVLNLSSPLQLDCKSIEEASAAGLIVTYEDHNVRTGIGSIIGTFLSENGFNCCFKRMGIAGYGVSACPEYQYKYQGLDEDSLVALIRQYIKNK